MNDLFNYFGFDFSDLAKKLEGWKDQYENFINDNVKKYDLSTQEGYENFIKDAANIRTKLLASDSAFANKYLVSVLDSLVQKTMSQHAQKVAEAKKEDKVKDIVSGEVNRAKTENHGKVNTGTGVKKEVEKKNEVEWPSDGLTYKQKRNIWKLVDEYMDEKVIPYLDEDVDEDAINDMSSGLFEFAAWIMTHEDE